MFTQIDVQPEWFILLGVFLAALAEKATTSKTDTNVESPTKDELKKMIIEGEGNKILRAYYWFGLRHKYTFEDETSAGRLGGYNREGSIGFAVSEEQYIKIKEHCPELVKATLAQKESRPPLSKFSTGEQPEGYEVENTFYCAPRKGYCGGANHELVEIHSRVGQGDNFYPSSAKEVSYTLKQNRFYNNKIAQRVCWVWQE